MKDDTVKRGREYTVISRNEAACNAGAFHERIPFTVLHAFVSSALFAFVLLCLSALPAVAEETPRLMILSSYHPGFIWSDDEVKGLLERLREVHPEIDVPIEYLDAVRHPGHENIFRTKEFLKNKYGGNRFDLVVCLDNPALEMILQFRHELFPDAPIVFGGINNFRSEMLSGHRRVTGVTEGVDIEGTLNVALALHPRTKRVLVIHDQTLSGLAFGREVQALMAAYSGFVHFTFMPPSTFEEATEHVRSLPDDSIALMLPFNTDRSGKSSPVKEFTRLVSSDSKAPIYGLSEDLLGHGIVGGLLLGGREHGRQVAEMALRILAGEDPDNIPIKTKSAVSPMFDHAQLMRFGVSLDALPSAALIVNRPPSILETHRTLVIGALGVITSLIAMIVLLSLAVMQRKRAEDELRKSEARYRLLSENTGDVIWTMDIATGRCTYMSPSVTRLCGYTVEEALGLTLEELLDPGFYHQFQEDLQERLATFSAGDESVRVQTCRMDLSCKDGFPVPTEVVTTLLEDEHGQVLEILGVARDITERLKAESALRESEEKFRMVAQNAEAIVFILDKRGNFRLSEGRALAKLGFVPNQAVGLSALELYRDSPSIHDSVQRALAGETLKVVTELRGSFFDTAYSPCYNMDGELDGVIGIAIDITERRLAEEALERSEERLRLALSASSQGLYDVNIRTGETQFHASPEYERLLGYEPGELNEIFQKKGDWVHPDDRERFLRAFEDCTAGKSNELRVEFRRAMKAGGWKWILSVGRVVEWDTDGQPLRLIGTNMDITRRKQMEDALLRTQFAIDHAMDSIHWVGPDAELIYVNEAMCRNLGYSKAELLSMRIFDIDPDIPRGEGWREHWKKTIDLGSVTLETRHRTKDGRVFPVEVSTSTMNLDGAVYQVAVARDITERKQAEKALRESEERFRAAFENVMIGRAILLPRGPIIQANEALARILGMPHSELSEKNWQELIHPDFLPEVDRLLRAKVGNEETTGQTESKLMRKDGNSVWVRISGDVVRDPDERPLYLVVDVEDISYRKEYEDRLRKYEQIVSASKDLLALVNRDYAYEAVNKSFLKAYQRTPEETIGHSVSDLMGECLFKTRVQPFLDRAFSGETVKYQGPFEFPGYGRRIVDMSYSPFLDDAGECSGVVVNLRDITETRELEQKLMQSQKMESIGTLAGGIAHEINNPVNGIMNYAQLIIDRSREGSPAVELAEEIIRETTRVAGIVRNLLTFARNEKQSHSPAHLSDIVGSVLTLIQTVMRHDQIDLKIDIPEDLPTVKCRTQQIQQVLMNLMTNARDALNEKYPDYSPEKQLRLAAGLIKKEGVTYVRTTVEDFGVGIGPDIRNRIFDPFFTTKPKETGTGLGLSIAYGIVKDHGGDISVETEPGQYTRIHMDLPVNNGWELSRQRP